MRDVNAAQPPEKQDPSRDFWDRVRRENRARDLHHAVQEILNLSDEIRGLATDLGDPEVVEDAEEQVAAAAGEISQIARDLDDRLDETDA